MKKQTEGVTQTSITRIADTLERVDHILAFSVDTRIRFTIVDIELTEAASESFWTGTNRNRSTAWCLKFIVTSATITAHIVKTLIHCLLTIGAIESGHTEAPISIDQIRTDGIVLTRTRLTLINIGLAMYASVTCVCVFENNQIIRTLFTTLGHFQSALTRVDNRVDFYE